MAQPIITPTKPVNYRSEHHKHFTEAYAEPYNKVLCINDARILFNGIVMERGLPVKASFYQYPEGRWSFIKKAYEQYITSSFARSRKFINHSETPLIVINQPWFNFYHWVLESLPRLYMAKDLLPNATLLLPKAYSNFSFVTETLKLLAPNASIIYNPDHNYKSAKVYLPVLRPYCHAYNVELLHNFSEYMLRLMELKEIRPERKILLVRRKAVARKIENSEEIERIAGRYGFEVVDMEDYSFTEQVKIMRSASHVVAQHGAGLTHLVFMHSASRVFELHKEVSNKEDHVSKVYWTLAAAMNIDYYYMFCRPVDAAANFFKADINIDPAKFEEELRNFIKV